MAVIERSGFYQSSAGESFLVTQGAVGYTLVAGKQCLFRVFMDSNQLDKVDYALVVVTRPVPHKPVILLVPKDYLVMEWGLPNGPSAGVVIRGFAFPCAGQYSVIITVYDAQGGVLQKPSIDPLAFHPTKDLRFMVVFGIHEGVFAATPTWTSDVEQSMLRLGSMFPVRDCVINQLYDNQRQGIQYSIGQPCDGWTDAYYDCVYGQTRAVNATRSPIAVTIEYRPGLYPPVWNPPGPYDPYPGAISGHPPVPRYGDLWRAACVAGNWQGIEMTAGSFAQEIGHDFGLEPPGSPHYQDPADPRHSKDGHIVDPFAYDFVKSRPYNPPAPGRFLGDAMNNFEGGDWQGADFVLFNAYDWEFLRSGIVQLDSSGTETNPCVEDLCPPLGTSLSIPRPPQWFRRILGNLADGTSWELSAHGLRPVPPRRIVGRRSFARNLGLREMLAELEREGIEEMYLPTVDETLSVVSRERTYRTLEGANVRIGGHV